MLCSVVSGALQHMALSSIHVVKRAMKLYLCRYDAGVALASKLDSNTDRTLGTIIVAYQWGAGCGAETLREVWHRKPPRFCAAASSEHHDEDLDAFSPS